MTNPLKILLVDDDRGFRDRLGKALELKGHSVALAGSSEAALTQLEVCVADAVVLELRIPGEPGLVLIRRLQEMYPEVRLVVLTGYGSIATALEAIRLGAADYLIKPVDPQQVENAVHGIYLPATDEVPVPSLERVEWEHLHRVLVLFDSNISQAARALGIDRRTLQRKLNRFRPPQ